MTTENTTTATELDSTTADDTNRPTLGDLPADIAGGANDAPAGDEVRDGDGDGETFPREVVERLRQENGRYRQRAQRADQLAQRLHTELVRGTGRLADPTDLPFDAAHLDDADALAGALDALLESKPHLAARRVAGDVGQGNRGNAAGSFSLLGALKGLT